MKSQHRYDCTEKASKKANIDMAVQEKHLIYGPHRYNCTEEASNVEQTSI